ncbi:MAG TPA: MerR family transcriptional regulator [Flavipsychrobacter sp.]|nr:MerR family transcriptional regulator [Flavipsychrobacter sp.]
MTVKALTLFGEEIMPEQIVAVGKSRAVKKKKEKVAAEEVIVTEEPEKETEILKGWEGDKQYYSIGEVASLFKVKTSHIRFWTNEFNLKVRTTRKGDRLYTPDQIREIRAIYNLVKEQGFTISGAKARLKDRKKMTVESVDLKQSLLQLRNKLLTIRNQLSS